MGKLQSLKIVFSKPLSRDFKKTAVWLRYCVGNPKWVM
jgi:hypothetical protein